jgi:hypothetical protein
MTMLEKLLQVLSDLITAINANTAALSAGEAPAKGKAKAAKDAAGSAAAATPVAAQPSAPVQAAPAAAAVQSTPSPAVTVSADEVGKLLIRVANEISRDAAVNELKKFGAEVFGGVKPEDYPKLKAAYETILSAKAGTVATGAQGLI